MCFAVATLVLTFPVSAHPTRMLPSDLIDTLLNTWIISWDADRLPHLLRGVWDAPIYYPYRDTLAFSENLLGLAFFVAPVRWITGNPVLTYNVAFFFSFTLAGTGMYLLVRDLTRSRPAAAVAGMCYAFCPFRMAQIIHVQMVATGWVPIALWGLHRYFATHRRRWLAVFAAAWILQALSNLYMFYFMAVVIAIVSVDGVIRERERRRRASIELIAAAVTVAVVLAPVGAAYYRVRSHYGQVRSAGEIEALGADLRSYLIGSVSTGVWRWLPGFHKNDAEKELFPGVFAVLLATVAITAARKRDAPLGRWVRMYTAIGLVAIVLSLGPHVKIWGWLLTEHGPYDWLARVVPGMDGMRVPARFAMVFSAALSVVAGCGTAILLARLRPRLRPVALALCLAAIVADEWSVPLPAEPYPPGGREEDQAVAVWLRNRPQGAVLHLPMTNVNFYELSYQYATLFHSHPLVNGFSGYNTRLQAFLRSEASPLVDFDRLPAAVLMLRSLGVRYVIIHTADYVLPAQWSHESERTIAGLRASKQIVAEQALPPVTAFELEPLPDAVPVAPERLVRIDDREIAVSASETPERLAYAFDNDPDSRWVGHQDGTSWIAAQLKVPHDVARIELQLAERSLVEHPRELQIDVTDAAGRSRTLYRASPYPELAAAIVRDGFPTLVIALPHNNASTISVRETAVTGGWWSVHELRLWRRD